MLQPSTYAALLSAFSSLLTVVIHTLLYERDLYPKTSFLTAKAYNFPVRQSRHPLVCQWVNDAVSAVQAELLKGTVANVVFAIFHPQSNKPLERWIFDVHRMSGIVPPKEAETTYARPTLEDEQQQQAEDVDMTEQFRAVLSKLSTSSSALKKLPRGCPFTLAIELKDEPEVDPSLGHPQPWIPAEPTLQKTKLSFTGDSAAQGVEPRQIGQDLGGARTVPVRTIRSGEMDFELWVEESQTKLQSYDESTTSSGKK